MAKKFAISNSVTTKRYRKLAVPRKFNGKVAAPSLPVITPKLPIGYQPLDTQGDFQPQYGGSWEGESPATTRMLLGKRDGDGAGAAEAARIRREGQFERNEAAVDDRTAKAIEAARKRPFGLGQKPAAISPFVPSVDTEVIEIDEGRVTPVAPVAPVDLPEDFQDESLFDAASVYARPADIADIDRLWDWIRTDVDEGRAFLGEVPSSSLHLHAAFRDLQDKDAAGTALVRALDIARRHQGFVIFNPLDTVNKVAVVQIYIAPEARGHLTTILPYLFDQAEAELPGLRFMITTDHKALAILLERFGFATTYVAIRKGGDHVRRGRRPDRRDAGVERLVGDLRA